MATKEESLQFLEEAQGMLSNMNDLKAESEEKDAQLKRKQKELEKEQKNMDDAIENAIKKRRAEALKPFEKEADDLKSQLKKEQSKREKAKEVGVKARIQHETSQLVQESQELSTKAKIVTSQAGLPGYVNSGFFQTMAGPKGGKEILTWVIVLAVMFAAIPLIVFLASGKSIIALVVVYIICAAAFIGLYYLIIIRTKSKNKEKVKEVRLIRDQRALKLDEIKRMTRDIRNDKNESMYNLGEFDQRIMEIERQLQQNEGALAAATEHFDNVTKAEITNQVTNERTPQIDAIRGEIFSLGNALEDVKARLNAALGESQEKYESVVGKDLMKTEKIRKLGEYLKSGQASSISEAMRLLDEGVKVENVTEAAAETVTEAAEAAAEEVPEINDDEI